MFRAVLIAALGCLAGCAARSAGGASSLRTGASPCAVPATGCAGSPPAPHDAEPDARRRVVALARGQLGKREVWLGGRHWRSDCAGFVEGVLAQVGVLPQAHARPGDNATTALYRQVQARGTVYSAGTPAPGDLVFFRDTYDRNRDGRRNDGLTHVGLVEQVDGYGTVSVIHRVARGVVRYRMNLSFPTVARDRRSGQVLNHALRTAQGSVPAKLTGQLFAAFGSLLGARARPPELPTPSAALQARAVRSHAAD